MRAKALLQEAAESVPEPFRPSVDAGQRSERLRVRNYDDAGHRIEVEALDGGDVAFESTYRLGPGGTAVETDGIDPGEYVVRVAVDGDRTAARECEVGDRPGSTALVECGNGIVAVSNGR